ncbi:lysophospholipid acyltransferase family protein [Nitrospirillum iridis]|uniref:KDO2-lipid IV(A) lauroyltransferase n=1 Tax=Nitrospirillum iridis TaxID=765888 RepID=A0A7X0EAX3_9PROT|nr:lauroyl acyltransferase [Nitrospirillum iridis]MBB6249570.1 KDO2-lipid IV(A) lauroyltransferase [Nitrospirillum iridis]
MATNSPLRAALSRNVRYPLEALAIRGLFGFLSLLPADSASDLGGWVGRTLGPRLKANRRVQRNLEQAMPELDAAGRARVGRESWDTLGRIMAEYAHFKTISAEWEDRVDFVGAEHLAGLRDDGKPGIVLTGHFGNWEMAGLASHKMDLLITIIYRAPNNPWVDRLLLRARSDLGNSLVPKGRSAAKTILATVRGGGHLGVLADQKLNEGIPVPFLGRDAMTGTITADMVLRHGAVVVPVKVTRPGKGARFRIEAMPPLTFAPTGDRAADIYAITLQINQVFETWVREDPGQWLWTHRRWPK